MSYSISLLGSVRRSSTNIAKQFCKLGCYNNVFVNKVFNICHCFPKCKQLNYIPEKSRHTQYSVYYNKRDCDCKDNICSLTNVNTMKHNKKYTTYSNNTTV